MHPAHLIRCASALGLAICVFLATSSLFFVLTVPGWPTLDLTAGATTYFTFSDTAVGKGVGVLALSFDTAAAVLFWTALWGLGSRLGGAISDARVAAAFRRLARAFAGFVLLRGLAIATLLFAYFALGGRAEHGLTIGHTGLLLGGLAGLVAWSVARLLAEAADVAADNAGFV